MPSQAPGYLAKLVRVSSQQRLDNILQFLEIQINSRFTFAVLPD
jgi:hypothetical protein